MRYFFKILLCFLIIFIHINFSQAQSKLDEIYLIGKPGSTSNSVGEGKSFGGNNTDSGSNSVKGEQFDSMQGFEGSSNYGSKLDMLGSLGGLGSGFQVHILGEVGRPGIYRLSPSTRLTDAIKMAKNINQKGSGRFIEIRRNVEGKVYTIDLRNYLIDGNIANNPFLLENDVIFVPLKKKVVQVEGSINRTGEYEVKNEKSLYDIIKAMGGFTVGVAQKEPIKIVRYDEEERKHIWDIENRVGELTDFTIKNGDVVVVPHMFTKENQFDYNLAKLPNDQVFYPSFEDRVFILGAVHTPGAYNFNQYYNLNHYISLAGGHRIDSKQFAMVVNRNGERRKVLAKDYENSLINPGDTVMIPQKKFNEQYWVGLFMSVVSMGFTVTALLKAF